MASKPIDLAQNRERKECSSPHRNQSKTNTCSIPPPTCPRPRPPSTHQPVHLSRHTCHTHAPGHRPCEPNFTTCLCPKSRLRGDARTTFRGTSIRSRSLQRRGAASSCSYPDTHTNIHRPQITDAHTRMSRHTALDPFASHLTQRQGGKPRISSCVRCKR